MAGPVDIEVIVDSMNPAERIAEVLRKNEHGVLLGSKGARAAWSCVADDPMAVSLFAVETLEVYRDLEEYRNFVSGYLSHRNWAKAPWMNVGARKAVVLPRLKLAVPPLGTEEMVTAGLVATSGHVGISPWNSKGKAWLSAAYGLLGALSDVYGNWGAAGRHFGRILPEWMHTSARVSRGLFHGAMTSLTGGDRPDAVESAAGAGREYLRWVEGTTSPCMDDLSVLIDNGGDYFLRVRGEALYADRTSHVMVRGMSYGTGVSGLQEIHSNGTTSAVGRIRSIMAAKEMTFLADLLARRRALAGTYSLRDVQEGVDAEAEEVETYARAWFPNKGGLRLISDGNVSII